MSTAPAAPPVSAFACGRVTDEVRQTQPTVVPESTTASRWVPIRTHCSAHVEAAFTGRLMVVGTPTCAGGMQAVAPLKSGRNMKKDRRAIVLMRRRYHAHPHGSVERRRWRVTRGCPGAHSFKRPRFAGGHSLKEPTMTSKLRITLVAALLAVPVTSFAAQKLAACGCGETCGCGESCHCAK